MTTNVGLIFEADSFDNFNKSLNKFIQISDKADKALTELSSGVKGLDDKKVTKFSNSLLLLSKSLKTISVSTDLAGLNSLYATLSKFDSANIKIPDFSVFVKTFSELGKIDANKIKSSVANLNAITETFTGTNISNALNQAANQTKGGALNLKSAFASLKSSFTSGDISSIFSTINPFFKTIDDFTGNTKGVIGKLRSFSNNDVEKLSLLTRSISSVFDSLRRISKIQIDTTALQKNMGALKEFVTSFSGKSIIERFGEAFSEISSSISGDISGIGLAKGFFGKVTSFFSSSSLKSFVNLLQPNGIINQFNSFNTKQVEGFRKLANSIRDITLAFQTISEISSSVSSFDPNSLKRFSESFIVIQNIMRQLVTSFTGGSFIDKAFNLFSSIKSGNTESIVKGAASLFGNNGIISELSRFNIPTISAFKDFSTSISQIIKEINQFALVSVDDAAIETLKRGLEKITKLFIGNNGFLFFKKSGVINDINSLGKSKIDGFSKFAEALSNVLRSISKISINDIDENIFEKIAKSILKSIPLFKTISGEIKKLDLKSIESFSKSLARIMNASLQKTRTDIRVDGIENDFEEQGNQSGLGFLKGFKNALGIRSPSRELIKIGVDAIKGFVIGITENSLVSNAINKIFGNIKKSFESIKNIFQQLPRILGESFGKNIANSLFPNIGNTNFISNIIKSSFNSVLVFAVSAGKSFGINFVNGVQNEVDKRLSKTVQNLIKVAFVGGVLGVFLARTLASTISLAFKIATPIIRKSAELAFAGIKIAFDLAIKGIVIGVKLLSVAISKAFVLSVKGAILTIKEFSKLTVSGLKIIENSVIKLGSYFKNNLALGINKAKETVSNFFNNFKPSNIINGLEAIGQKIFYIRQLFDTVYQAAQRFYDSTIGISVAFESAFAGVAKTLSIPVEILQQGQEAVDNFVQGIRDGLDEMATSPDSLLSGLDNSFITLSQIAENAGALGIAGEDVLDFTEVVGQLTLATDLSADSASFFLAQFATITKNSNFEQIGGAITALGNQTAATEAAISEIAQRIIGVGNAAGFSEAEILGWGATIRSVGIEAELGGTAFNTLITDVSTAVSKGGNELQQFANLAGLSASDFQEAWGTNPSSALQQVIIGLGELDNASRIRLLDNLGLDGARMTQFISLIASNTDFLTDNLNLANESFVEFGDNIEDFNALQVETERRAATTESAINRIKNVFKGLGDTIGLFFLPYFAESLNSISNAASNINNFLKQNAKEIETFISSVLTPIKELIGSFNNLYTSIFNFINVFIFNNQMAQSFINGVLSVVSRINSVFTSLTNNINRFSQRLNSLSSVFMPRNEIDNTEELNNLYSERISILEEINAIRSGSIEGLSEETGHIVEAGDTLWDLAQRYGTTVDELRRLNPELNGGSLITVGQDLRIFEGSRLKDLQSRLKSINSTVSELTNRAILSINPSIIDNAEQLSRYIDNISNNIGIVWTGFNQLVSGNIVTGINSIEQGISGIATNLLDIFDIFTTSNPEVDIADFSYIDASGLDADSFGSTLPKNPITEFFKSLIEQAKTSGVSELISENLIQIFSLGFQLAIGAFNPLALGLSIIPILATILESDSNSIGEALQKSEIGASLYNIVVGLGNAIGETFSLVFASLNMNDEKGSKIFEQKLETFTSSISQASEGLTTAIILAIQSSFENLPELIRSGAGIALTIFNSLSTIASAILEGIGEALSALTNEEKMKLAAQLVIVLSAAALLISGVGAVVGLGSAIIGAIVSGIVSVGLSGVAIVGLAVALVGVMIAAITNESFRNELSAAFEETIDSIFGKGTFDNFQASVQEALVGIGISVGNTVLGFFDYIRSQISNIIVTIGEGLAGILQSAGLTGEASALRDILQSQEQNKVFFEVQSSLRFGENVGLNQLSEAIESGRAIGVNVDFVVAELDSRIQELLNAAGDDPLLIQAQIEGLINIYGTSLEDINRNLIDAGFTDEQVQQLVDSLFASGTINVGDIPIIAEGFDITFTGGTDDLQKSLEDSIKLGDLDSAQRTLDIAEDLGVTLDLTSLIALAQQEFNAAVASGDLGAIGQTVIRAEDLGISLDPTSLIQSIANFDITGQEFLDNAILSEIIFGSGALEFTPEQVANLSTSFAQEIETMRSFWGDELGSMQFEELGGNLIQGVIDGMQYGETGLRDEAVNQAQSVIDEFELSWGIQSPSTVMMGIGEMLMQGLVIGISNYLAQFQEIFSLLKLETVLLYENTVEYSELLIESYEDLAYSINSEIKKIMKQISDLTKTTNTNFSYMITASSVLSIAFKANLETIRPTINALTTEVYELADAFYTVILQAVKAQGVIQNALDDLYEANLNLTPNSGGKPDNKLGGGHKYGGDVSAGRVYEILEGNLPFELFQTSNRTFFLPNTGGRIISPLSTDMNANFKPSNESKVSNNYGGNVIQINVPVQIDGITGDISNERINEISSIISDNVSARVNTASQKVSLTTRLNRRGKT